MFFAINSFIHSFVAPIQIFLEQKILWMSILRICIVAKTNWFDLTWIVRNTNSILFSIIADQMTNDLE